MSKIIIAHYIQKNQVQTEISIKTKRAVRITAVRIGNFNHGYKHSALYLASKEVRLFILLFKLFVI